MQGTNLQELYGDFGAPVSNASPSAFYESNHFPPLFGSRPFPSIQTKDLSGSMLFEIEQQRIMQGLTEDFPEIDTATSQLQLVVDRYKNLKEQQMHLNKELEVIEKYIKDLESGERKYKGATLEFKNLLLHNQILAKDEYDTLQQKINELNEIQIKFLEKCLAQYKEQALSLHEKLSSVMTILSAYTEFIKTGVHEMVGSDVKANACSICLEKEITHCLAPCGHTFCFSCIQKSAGNTCMTCRAPIQSKVKMFLSL